MVGTLGQQYNIGEKPTVILYTYMNRHAGTPEKQRIKYVVMFVVPAWRLMYVYSITVGSPPTLYC